MFEMIQKTNSNKKLNNKKKIKDDGGTKNLKRKLISEETDDLNSAEGNNEVVEKSITNKLSPKKLKKAKLEVTTESEKADSACDSSDEEVTNESEEEESGDEQIPIDSEEEDSGDEQDTGESEDEDSAVASDDAQGNGSNENENANHHNKVQRKKSDICQSCGDKGHKIVNCPLLDEDMEVVECCKNCLSPDHSTDDCSEVKNSQKVCYNCGEEGHMSKKCPNGKSCDICKSKDHLRKDCPDNSEKKSQNVCHNCEEEGHFSKNCPNGKMCDICKSKDHLRKDCPDNSQKEADMVCFGCNETGHFSRKCPKKDGNSGRGGRFNTSSSFNRDSARPGGCYNCQDPDHTSQTCENECTFCRNNEDGHMRKDCPRAVICRNCGGKHRNWECEEECKLCQNNFDGHARKDCTKGSTCFNCNQSGHVSRDCPNARQGGRGRGGFGGRGGRRGSSRGGGFGGSCFNCDEVGHRSSDCPKKGFVGRGRGGGKRGQYRTLRV